MSSAIPTSYKAVQVEGPKKGLKFITVQMRELKENEVLVKVEACGMCHSDAFVVDGGFPAVTYPRIPGHEVAGTVSKVGSGVKLFKAGDRVGRGWHGSHCFYCYECRKGDFSMCKNNVTTGITDDGGYAEYMIAPWESLAFIPDNVKFEDAGPLMCAGVTVFNGLRQQRIIAPANIVVQGIGGLGSLGIQFAARMGYTVIALSTSDDKKELATKLGAAHYINTKSQNAVEEINKLGGAKLILATAYDAKSAEALIPALGVDGVLLGIGVDNNPISAYVGQLLPHRSSVRGWFSGGSIDSEDTLKFSAQNNIQPMVETYPLDKVEEAYKRMVSGKAKFRVVLLPSKK
jgi:propanol-preferring alcohol dehydrogenase